MSGEIHLHFHINAQVPLADEALRAVISFMRNLNLATVAHSGVAGKIDPAPCSITRAIADWQADMERRGCKPASVRTFGTHATRLVEFANWSAPDQITLAGAIEYLAAKRKSGWSGTTHDGAVSALRNFGAFLAKTGVLTANPLEHLESSGETGGQGARALTLDEARALVATARQRAARTGKDKSSAALFYLTLLHTGLRHAEASALLWGDLDLDGETPVLVSNPAWSKNGRRELVPLHRELYTLLREHRKGVQNGRENKVFPHVPNRHTWDVDREAAGIKRIDARGRQASYHSTRKYLATMLDRTGASPGVVSRILRHADTLAQSRYIDHDLSAEVAAIAALPALWVKNGRNALEELCPSDDTSPAEEVRPMVAIHNHKSTSEPAQAHSRPQQSTRDRAGFDLDFLSAPLSQDTASRSRAVEHGNGQSRACAQSPLIAALEAQARAVLAMCEALRRERDRDAVQDHQVSEL